MERFVDDDGMVRSHCDMNTSTGRILSVEPNVQTVPKDDLVDGMGLRHLFRAQPGEYRRAVFASWSCFKQSWLGFYSRKIGIFRLCPN